MAEDRYGSEFGLEGVLGDRPLVEPKLSHRDVPEPNESIVQTLCFIMDNLPTGNRRQGDYHEGHKGVPVAYRYTHPGLNDASIPALASYLNMVSQAARPVDWEKRLDSAANASRPIPPEPWNTLPFYGDPVYPEGGGTVSSRQLDVLTLAAASRVYDSPFLDDTEKVRTAVERLRSSLKAGDDRPGTAAPMIVEAVREIARIPADTDLAVSDMVASAIDRITDNVEMYCKGGERELPFALRFDGIGLEATWNRWNSLEGDERTAEVKGTVMSLGGDLATSPSGRACGLDITALDPNSNADWRICDEIWSKLCLRHAEEALGTRAAGNATYIYRLPKNDEAHAEAEKKPFRLDWNTAEPGVIRMYVNALGFGCERPTKSGRALLILESADMFVKGMETGYTDIYILEDGMLVAADGCVGEDGGLCRNNERRFPSDKGRELKRYWEKGRESLAEWGKEHGDMMPDDERHLLYRMTAKKDPDAARPIRGIRNGGLTPDNRASSELLKARNRAQAR